MVRQLARCVPVLVCFACATSGGPLPPGDELEDPDNPPTVMDARGNARVPPSRQPTQDELLSAFEAPEPSRARSAALTGQGKVASEPAEDPLAAPKAAFVPREGAVRRLVRARKPEAVDAARELAASAAALGPAYVARAAKLRAEAALAVKDEASAHELGWAWLLACGPDAVDRCRAEALALVARTAKKADHPARAKAKLDALRSADKCLKSAEAAARARSTPPACVDEAARTYRANGDDLMAARALIARGAARGYDIARLAEAARDLERAERECEAPRCSAVRRRALQLLVGVYLRANAPEQAAKAALREAHLHASTLPPAERAYTWSNDAAKACAAYEAQAGQGACRKLEKALAGAHAFRDYSREAAAGEGLSMDVVREVNAHFQVTFEDCLTQEALRLRPPAQERYLVRWVVLNDGRVGEMHMDRKGHDDGPLAQCLRQRLAVWRYPRYQGEYQHVEQSFVVSASRR